MASVDRPGDTARKRPPFRKPQMWIAIISVPITVMVTIDMVDKRGIAMAVMTAVVWGSIDIAYLLFWDRMMAFSRAWPVLDTLITIPGMFIVFAYLLPWSLPICAIIAVGVALLVAVLRAYAERRQASS